MVGEGSDPVPAARATREGVELSAIVVAYRQPELLTECVAALAAGTRRPDEIIVVDVDPQAPVALAAAAAPVPLHRLPTADNPGYAAACNRGAAEANGRWLLFMNADVAVSPATVGAVLDEADRDGAVAIATPRLLRPDGTLDHACHRGIPTVMDSLWYKLGVDRMAPDSRRFGHYRLTWLDPAETHDIEACSGAFMLVRRDSLEAAGSWDEGYRFYGEDLDLCLRIRRRGGHVRYVGTATALHHKGAASSLQADPRSLSPEQRATRQRVRREIVDSHERFYHQHLQAGTPRLLRPLVRLMFRLQRWKLGRARG